MTAPNLLKSSEQAELYLRGSDTPGSATGNAAARRAIRTATTTST